MNNLNTRFLFLLLSAALSQGCAQTDTLRAEGKKFAYTQKDANQRIIVLGEFFQNGVRNGEWRRFDQDGRLLAIEGYRNDTLTGLAHYFHYPNPGQVYEETGWMDNSGRISIWTTYEGKTAEKTDRKVSYIVYGTDARPIARFLLHPNGRIALEILMNGTGQPCWYRSYNKSGELLFEGADLPYFYDSMK